MRNQIHSDDTALAFAPAALPHRGHRMTIGALASLLAILLALAPASAATLIGLGDLPGGDFYSQANGISADGSVVVGHTSSGSGPQAFRWTREGGMVGLGDLSGGAFSSAAYGVNGDGSVIVGSGTSTSGSEAFRWASNGGMTGLGILPGGVFGGYSVASSVSGDGSAVVGSSTSIIPGSASRPQAFRWTPGGGMVGLGDPPPENPSQPRDVWFTAAESASGDGSVVVGRIYYFDNSTEAFFWTSGGGMVGLGDLPGGTFESWAYDASTDGSVIVGVGSTPLGLRPFRWTRGGGMVSLGDVPAGSFSIGARAVSGDGSVIVGASAYFTPFFEPAERAVYWTADGGMQALWDVLISHGVDPATAGWTELSSAEDISADGTTIVGYGTRNGMTEAFVAVVPEPSGVALLALSSALLWRRQRSNSGTLRGSDEGFGAGTSH